MGQVLSRYDLGFNWIGFSWTQKKHLVLAKHMSQCHHVALITFYASHLTLFSSILSFNLRCKLELEGQPCLII